MILMTLLTVGVFYVIGILILTGKEKNKASEE